MTAALQVPRVNQVLQNSKTPGGIKKIYGKKDIEPISVYRCSLVTDETKSYIPVLKSVVENLCSKLLSIQIIEVLTLSISNNTFQISKA